MAHRNAALYARVSEHLRNRFNGLATERGTSGAELLRSLALAELAHSGRPVCPACEQDVPVLDNTPQWHSHGGRIIQPRED